MNSRARGQNVFLPIAQRRHASRHHVQTIEEVLAEAGEIAPELRAPAPIPAVRSAARPHGRPTVAPAAGDLRSTFISYGNPDEACARKLYEALHGNGVTTFFFFREHAVPGEKLHRMTGVIVLSLSDTIIVAG
jgi:hypothetical protein